MLPLTHGLLNLACLTLAAPRKPSDNDSTIEVDETGVLEVFWLARFYILTSGEAFRIAASLPQIIHNRAGGANALRELHRHPKLMVYLIAINTIFYVPRCPSPYPRRDILPL